MDPLTHTLTGAALAGSALRHRTPLATATLIVAANAPDVDFLAYLGGPYRALVLRRGLTHGLAAAVVLPLAVAGGVLAWDRWVRRRRRPDASPARPAPVLGLACLGVLTHPVLDWMNTYGMRWWLPFDGGWSYGDALFIVDPWIWLVLGGALFLGFGARHTSWWLVFWGLATVLVVMAPVAGAAKGVWSVGVGSLLVARAVGPPGRRGLSAGAAAGVGGGADGRDPTDGLVRWTLLGAVVYVTAMTAFDLAGRRAALRALEEAGTAAVLELVVAPVPAHPLAGEIVARTPGGDLRGRIRWAPGPRVELFDRGPVPAVRPGPRVDPTTAGRAASVARSVPEVDDYLIWSRLPTYEVSARDEGWRVDVGDARYPGVEGGGLGGPTVDLDARFRVVEVR